MADDIHLEPYLAVVERVSELARSTDKATLDEPVPACPDWSARDVVAHLAGLAQDWVAGALDDYGSDAWASAQVTRFDDQPIEAVLAAWETAAGRFSSLPKSPLGGTAAMWAFGDAVVHEADLRPVLAPGTRVPADATALALKAAIARWRGELGNAGVPALDVIATDSRTWRIGDPDSKADSKAETVTTTSYELSRALFGRRSRAQVEAWEWSTDPAVYLDVNLPYPFKWAEAAITD